MLAGKKKLLGSGNIRDVFLVDYHGRKFVLKTLREDFVATALRTKKMHRWEAAALDAVRSGVWVVVEPVCITRGGNITHRVIR